MVQKIEEEETLCSLKLMVSQRFQIAYEKVSLHYTLENTPNMVFEILKDEDISSMIDIHRRMGLSIIKISANGEIGVSTSSPGRGRDNG